MVPTPVFLLFVFFLGFAVSHLPIIRIVFILTFVLVFYTQEGYYARLYTGVTLLGIAYGSLRVETRQYYIWKAKDFLRLSSIATGKGLLFSVKWIWNASQKNRREKEQQKREEREESFERQWEEDEKEHNRREEEFNKEKERSRQEEELNREKEQFERRKREWENSKQRSRSRGRMSREEAYETLELNSNATREEIKKAHRRLMKEYHPDKLKSKNLSDTQMKLFQEKAKRINEAYGILTDS